MTAAKKATTKRTVTRRPKRQHRNKPTTVLTLRPDLLAELAARMSPGVGRTAVVERMLGRYLAVVGRCLPSLSRSDWATVADALRTGRRDEAGSVASLPAEVAVRMQVAGASADEWQRMMRRLLEMTYAELVAVADTVERYWAAVARGESAWLPGE